jgi:hypothetical protein
MIIDELGKVVLVVVNVWLFFFLAGRVLLFSKEYAIAEQHFKDDQFTLRALCDNNDIKANLGKNIHICDQASINVHIQPWVTATHSVMKQTYLCGNVQCMDLYSDITSSVHKIVFTGILIVLCPYFAYAFYRCFQQKIAHARAQKKVHLLQDTVLPMMSTKNYKGD